MTVQDTLEPNFSEVSSWKDINPTIYTPIDEYPDPTAFVAMSDEFYYTYVENNQGM